MTETLFHRLRRYARSPLRNAREDRLTEALATTLNAAPDAARFIVQKTFDLDSFPKGDVTAATQVLIHGRSRIDLELRFEGEGSKLVTWFESKVDSPAYVGQGAAYMEQLEGSGDSSGFAWLTRPEARIDGGLPSRAAHINWQDLAEWLRDWLSEGASDQSAALGPWFVAQFLRHLEEEEQLVHTEPFTTDDASALSRAHQAQASLKWLVQSAADRAWTEWGRYDPAQRLELQERWGGAEDEKWLKERGRDLAWFKYPCVRSGQESRWPSGWWFEFDLIYDNWRLETQSDQLVVCAGLAYRTADRELSDKQFEAYVEELDGDGFEYGQVGGPGEPWDVLFAHWTLDDLANALSGRTAGEQSAELCGLVVGSFHDLNAVGPPS